MTLAINDNQTIDWADELAAKLILQLKSYQLTDAYRLTAMELRAVHEQGIREGLDRSQSIIDKALTR